MGLQPSLTLPQELLPGLCARMEQWLWHCPLPQEPHVPITRGMHRGPTAALGCGAVLLWAGAL